MRKLEVANCENFEDSVEGNLTQTDNDFGLDDLNFAFEVGLAGIQLGGSWLVAWRGAATRCGDVHIFEDETIAS